MTRPIFILQYLFIYVSNFVFNIRNKRVSYSENWTFLQRIRNITLRSKGSCSRGPAAIPTLNGAVGVLRRPLNFKAGLEWGSSQRKTRWWTRNFTEIRVNINNNVNILFAKLDWYLFEVFINSSFCVEANSWTLLSYCQTQCLVFLKEKIL